MSDSAGYLQVKFPVEGEFRLEPDALIWFNPQHITSFILDIPESAFGKALPGDWDLAAKPLSASPKITFCLEHWRNGVPWERTGIYDFLLRSISRGGWVRGCSTKEDLTNRYARVDSFYKSIKTSGYRTAFQLQRSTDPHKEPYGILIHIDRNRCPIFGGEGHHRLAAGIALGLDKVPARIGVVHPMALTAPPATGAEHPLVTHAGQGHEVNREPEQKLELIRSKIDLSQIGSAIDVGCSQGLLTALLAKEGIFCVGLDVKPYFLAQGFKQESSPAFAVLPMTPQRASQLPRFDLVLLLSVHHQWISLYGEKWAKRAVGTLANKARKAFVIEFSALSREYGAKGLFKDNDEEGVKAYALNWLNSLPVAGERIYLGRNPEAPPREPYRYVFAIERQPAGKE